MKQLLHTIHSSREVSDGLLFIPDISGFTELVHSADVVTGREITYELLSAVMRANELGLHIAEVEGDAILFYRYGAAPSLSALSHQYEIMKTAFEQKKKQLEEKFSMELNLRLKVIAHYGPMTSYKIGPFEKLYGEVVVEAHRLLKNSIDGGSYLLLTDALLARTAEANIAELGGRGITHHSLCEVYGSSRNICFTYLNYRDIPEKVA